MMNIKKILKNSLIYLLLLGIFVYKDLFIKVLDNVSSIFLNKDNISNAETALLKEKLSSLEKEYQDLTELKQYATYDYKITRLNYRSSYLSDDIVVFGGKDYGFSENFAVVNEKGLVGIVEKVYNKYSKVKLLTGITNLSVQINNVYGTLVGYQDDLFIIEGLSNYDEISLNDEVYTSTLGVIKEKIKVGNVYKIEEAAASKTIYIKSSVDFSDLNYFYVVGEK